MENSYFSHYIKDNNDIIPVLRLPELIAIKNEIVADLIQKGFQRLFDSTLCFEKDGFKRTPILRKLLDGYLSKYSVDEKSLMIEIVEVGKNKKNNGTNHVHEVATAVTTCLGKMHGLEDPKDAKFLCSSFWTEVGEGSCVALCEEIKNWPILEINQTVIVHPGQIHNFTTDNGGYLSFLTVTSPQVGRDNDRPDWVKAKVEYDSVSKK
jgi:hypothetical protein